MEDNYHGEEEDVNEKGYQSLDGDGMGEDSIDFVAQEDQTSFRNRSLKSKRSKKMEEGSISNRVNYRGRQALEEEAMERITERLSSLENLYFPQALLPKASSPSLRKPLLLHLLHRDIPLFLERYGPRLTSEELQEFDVLKDNYEINWHLKHLRSKLCPTSEQVRFRSLTIKNRRRAYMGKIMSEGNYFSEDAMREREPYLHHEYVGKFQDPYGRRMARPGERWSDTLMRRAEEAILLAKIRGEQQRLGVDESEWVGDEIANRVEEEEEQEEEEEEENDEHDENEDEKANVHVNRVATFPEVQSTRAQNGATDSMNTERPMLSPTEMQEQMDHFTCIMQQRFLSGQDHEHINYSKIDEDETLDDHWSKEANYDAEEKYFEQD